MAAPDARVGILKDASESAKALGTERSYYLTVMQRIIDDSEDYIQKETARYGFSLTVNIM